MKSKILTKDTRVIYSRQFLRNTGQFTGEEAPTSGGPHAAGIIEDDNLELGEGFVSVLWDDKRTTTVLAVNLHPENRKHTEIQ